MSLYKILNNVFIRKKIKNIEKFLADNHENIYKKVFLPVKNHFKVKLLKSYMNNNRKVSNDLYWINRKPDLKTSLCYKNWIYLNNQKIPNCITGPKIKYEPLISVIVPNYNHEAYLRERLESIYNQTYKHYEVILLDDCSTDNSRNILLEYRDKYPKITRVYLNDVNGKNVFKQWEKGLRLAKGDLIWIAESDDYCEHYFLEKIVPTFCDDANLLSFCRTDFIKNGEKIYSTEEYLADIKTYDWNKSFATTAHHIVKNAFAIKNIIPNVSSVIFRKRNCLNNDLQKLLKSLKLCGDWVFYLDTIKGGVVSYVKDVTNFYRIHENSTSLRVQKESRYYKEHEIIAKFIIHNYKISENEIRYLYERLKEHFYNFFGGTEESQLREWFDLNKIINEKNSYSPNILMCIFSMQSGGGEIFPIFLANQLRDMGCKVTICDFDMESHNKSIQKMINSDISYVRLNERCTLRYVIDQFGIDILHSHHGCVDELIMNCINPVEPIRHLVSLHGMYEAMDGSDFQRISVKSKENKVNYVYIADKNLKPFINNGWRIDDRFKKIGNGLKYSISKPLNRSTLGISKCAFVFCIVSRAIPEKGWEKAAKAVADARIISKKDIHLILVGDGEIYDKMKNYSPNFIHLLGFRDDPRNIFATSDMGLLPSEFKGESFPLTIIDCLFAGKPVLATDIGEVKNQLMDEHNNMAGMVVPLIDGRLMIDDLTKSMVKIVTDKDFYIMCCSYVKNVSKKFYIENVAQNYSTQYMKIFKNEI